MIGNALLGFGWYDAKTLDGHLWHWSRDITEIKVRDIELVQLTFFTKYEEVVGLPR
jgi:hypothetical protein